MCCVDPAFFLQLLQKYGRPKTIRLDFAQKKPIETEENHSWFNPHGVGLATSTAQGRRCRPSAVFSLTDSSPSYTETDNALVNNKDKPSSNIIWACCGAAPNCIAGPMRGQPLRTGWEANHWAQPRPHVRASTLVLTRVGESGALGEVEVHFTIFEAGSF